MYSKFFKSNEQIKAEKALADRTHANFLRADLTQGYPEESGFYQLVHSLSDTEILQNHADHKRSTMVEKRSWVERTFLATR